MNIPLTVNDWAIQVGRHVTNYTPPELVTTHLTGKLENYKYITTSPIVGKTTEDGIVTRSGTVYTLGEVSQNYEKAFPDARNRLLKTLPLNKHEK